MGAFRPLHRQRGSCCGVQGARCASDQLFEHSAAYCSNGSSGRSCFRAGRLCAWRRKRTGGRYRAGPGARSRRPLWRNRHRCRRWRDRGHGVRGSSSRRPGARAGRYLPGAGLDVTGGSEVIDLMFDHIQNLTCYSIDLQGFMMYNTCDDDTGTGPCWPGLKQFLVHFSAQRRPQLATKVEGPRSTVSCVYSLLTQALCVRFRTAAGTYASLVQGCCDSVKIYGGQSSPGGCVLPPLWSWAVRRAEGEADVQSAQVQVRDLRGAPVAAGTSKEAVETAAAPPAPKKEGRRRGRTLGAALK